MSKVNAWKYGRQIYLIGRSHKFRYLTQKERESVIVFITQILKTRPSIAARLNLKYENAGRILQKQNGYALLKMVQVIGRNLKVLFPTEEEKTLCDNLIAQTDFRRRQSYKNYVTDVIEQQTESNGQNLTQEQQTNETEEQKEQVKQEEQIENTQTEQSQGQQQITE